MMISGVSGEGRADALRNLAKIVAASRSGDPTEELDSSYDDKATSGDWTP